MDRAYIVNDLVRVKADGGTFGGCPVLIRAVVPRMDVLGSIYIVHPPKEPNNKREIPQDRIGELLEASPLPPPGPNRIMLHVPVRDGTIKKETIMPTVESPHIPPLTLSDDMDPLTKAERIEEWMKRYERTPVQTAIHLGLSRASVDNYRLLLKAPDELKGRIRARAITMYKALDEMKGKVTHKESPATPSIPEPLVDAVSTVETHTHPTEPADDLTIPPSAFDIVPVVTDEVLTTPPAPTEHTLTAAVAEEFGYIEPPVKEDLTFIPEPIVAPNAPASLLKVRISDLESQLEWATTNLEKTVTQLRTAENEIRRLHQQLETAAPPTLQITINGGTFHLYGGEA